MRAGMDSMPMPGALATLSANLLGALAIGAFWSCCGPDGRWPMSPPHRFGIMTGFLGSLTTFSMAGLDIAARWLEGDPLAALGWAAATLGGAVMVCRLGAWLGQRSSPTRPV